mmetsp:Transcript_26113/g.72855  ORF Transcript_26113/g.72855 Transcript_26113/m.72855 type:complete len:356 (+) Transcript_26113:1971-3038(+)
MRIERTEWHRLRHLPPSLGIGQARAARLRIRRRANQLDGAGQRAVHLRVQARNRREQVEGNHLPRLPSRPPRSLLGGPRSVAHVSRPRQDLPVDRHGDDDPVQPHDGNVGNVRVPSWQDPRGAPMPQRGVLRTRARIAGARHEPILRQNGRPRKGGKASPGSVPPAHQPRLARSLSPAERHASGNSQHGSRHVHRRFSFETFESNFPHVPQVLRHVQPPGVHRSSGANSRLRHARIEGIAQGRLEGMRRAHHEPGCVEVGAGRQCDCRHPGHAHGEDQVGRPSDLPLCLFRAVRLAFVEPVVRHVRHVEERNPLRRVEDDHQQRSGCHLGSADRDLRPEEGEAIVVAADGPPIRG